ncbi:MAG TPA: DNA recombination protein RmuC, partial [Leptospiraceae bacterium]|nr:DNA recombination protein RmuC [Leptospiraceae bacterium]
MDFLFLLAGLIIGALIMWLFRKSASDPRVPELERNLTESERQKSVLEERIRQAEASAKTATDLLNEERRRVIELSTKIATLQAESKNYLDRLENQKSELENLHQRFKAEFENLSAAILEEKSKKFTEQNRANLDIILNPLKEKLKDFEQKVEQSYKIESAERNTLKGEIKNLIDLNRQISEEANNLAKALKGDTKKQGNWGEVILERILERSGLIKGSEYELQFSTTNEEGRRIQPDVIINLPDNKHLIVDSKVSLVAYEAMVNAANEEDREKALKEH